MKLDSKKYCCPVLEMILTERGKDTDKIGLSVGSAFSMKSGEPVRLVLVYNMRKGPKTGKFSKYAATTYASVTHCPFCGEKVD